MIEIIQSERFSNWLYKLRDKNARDRILVRLLRAEDGNLGDVKSIGSGVYEMRIHYGNGYRLYFTQRGRELIIMLAGGDKSTQQKDIAMAIEIAKQWDE